MISYGEKARWRRLLSTVGVICLLAAMCSLGCSRAGHANAPVNGPLARKTLYAALNRWKSGDSAESLKHANPPIYIIDLEWQFGAKLRDFQIQSDGDEKDAHLHCPVRLIISGPAGQEVKRDVTYIISTAPNLTVSRKVF